MRARPRGTRAPPRCGRCRPDVQTGQRHHRARERHHRASHGNPRNRNHRHPFDVRHPFRAQGEKIEVLVELQPWKQDATYDRTGLASTMENVMGQEIPRVLIPVAPGKNLTVISEVIAMNTLMKMNGVDTAREFNDSLLKTIQNKQQGRKAASAFDEDPLMWDSYE